MTTTHTPGPWYTMGAGVYTGSPQNDDIVQIATAHFYGVPGDPMANARLIAAAPAMLEALRGLTAIVESYEYSRPWPGRPHAQMDAARAAIARATA